MGLITWFGRMLLWIFLLPVGIWRSLVHHRKKGTKKAVEQMRKAIEKRDS